MRSIRAGLAFLLAFAASGFAQDDADPFQQKLDEKLKKPFVKNVAWELDFDQARAKAASGNKLVFAYFTRSYAP